MGSLTDLKTNKTLFILCDCGSEILTINYDHTIKTADLAIYESYSSYKFKMSLYQRLRYCWQVLWHKKPYADQIELNEKQLKDLKSFLLSINP